MIYVTGVAHDFGFGGLRICPDLDALRSQLDSTDPAGHVVVRELLERWGLSSADDSEFLTDEVVASALARNLGVARGWTLARTTAEQLASASSGTPEIHIPTVLPISDDPIELHVIEPDGEAQRGVHVRRWLANPARPEPLGFAMAGLDSATAAPGVLDAIRSSDVVLLPPMSPILDAAGLLGVSGVRDGLRGTTARVVALSPVGLVGQRDPQAERAAWRQAGLAENSGELARLYSDFLDHLIIDDSEAAGRYPTSLTVSRAPLAAAMSGDSDAAERVRAVIMDSAG